MALFCAAIVRDQVGFFSFPFLSHIQVFSCEISPVCRLKNPCSCFSSYLCFVVFLVLFVLMLLVLLLASLICSLSYLMLFSGFHIDASMLSLILTTLSFLDTYSQCHLPDVRSCASSSIFLSSGSFVWVSLLSILRMVPIFHKLVFFVI